MHELFQANVWEPLDRGQVASYFMRQQAGDIARLHEFARQRYEKVRATYVLVAWISAFACAGVVCLTGVRIATAAKRSAASGVSIPESLGVAPLLVPLLMLLSVGIVVWQLFRVLRNLDIIDTAAEAARLAGGQGRADKDESTAPASR